jgi:hypothetical protein
VTDLRIPIDGAAPSELPPDPDWRHDAHTVQILTAEHWSLLASRSLAWTESFSRANAFLTAVSGAVVALALVGQSTGYGRAFVTFALILLPVVLFVGLTTVIRLNQVNDLDLIYLQAMNRLRRAYLDLVPGVAPYFSMASHDDLASSLFSGFAVHRRATPLVQGFMTNPALIGVICSVVSGVIAAIVASQLAVGVQGSIVAGVAGFLACLVGLSAYSAHAFAAFARALDVRFPPPVSPAPTGGPSTPKRVGRRI